MKRNQNKMCYGIAGVALFAMGAYAWHRSNHHIEMTSCTHKDKNLPHSFQGFRILHVSDLHNTSFGRNQRSLLKQVKQANPDIIVISGDLLDKRRSTKQNITSSLTFVRQAMILAPIYYVPGNHEATSKLYPYLKQCLKQLGVHVLEHSKVTFTRHHESITLLGIKDPKFYRKDIGVYEASLEALVKSSTTPFTMLLSHRPEKIDLYAKEGVSLCFCGHAHGGQIRLPFFGGIYAPDQGLFPNYTNGAYRVKDTVMYVSRGLGNSRAPLRINNHPQLLCITLSCES